MSKGRVVAIYHKETRKVLGRISCSVITKQTSGYRPVYKVMYQNCIPLLSALGPFTTQINYKVVHDNKGNPIKVIAESQKEADMLIDSERSYCNA